MVNRYLTDLASKLIITSDERDRIDGNLSVLSSRLSAYFNSADIGEKFVFGSYSRKTLMPRRADPYSDVDYMIVFKNGNSSPSTYINRLKNFAEAKYPSSEIYRSFPTVVLELSRIIIELVPSILTPYGTYQIPSKESNYSSWLYTYPNSFNAKVREKNQANNGMIRPLIRLMKYWNAKNDYVFSSYDLENRIVDNFYLFCNSFEDYVEVFVNSLNTYGMSIRATTAIDKLKRNVTDAIRDDKNGYPLVAEVSIKSAFPPYL